MSLKQKVGCAIHGHVFEHREVDGWVVSTCQRCGTVCELPASAYSVAVVSASSEPGMGTPGLWIGVIDCGDGGG